MFLNTRASSGAGPKAAALIGIPRRLAFAASLTVLLAGAEVSAGGDDGPMASAPLPPPLPSAPRATEVQPPQASAAARPALPRVPSRAESGTHVAQPPRRSSEPHAIDRFGRNARGQKRLAQRAVGDGEHPKGYIVPQAAHATAPPPPPLPFPYGYFPGAAPAYGYALVYPPLPPGPVWPH